jgi:N-acetylmuramoyl-L-alanine amidase
MKICIDAGHGGHDPGAVGPTDLAEAPTALDICRYLCDIFGGSGFELKMTRTTDDFVTLADRCSIANIWGAAYFISVHCNSDGPDAEGIETLYKSQKGLDVAIPIQNALVLATGDRDRGVKKRNDLYVLNGTNMPAVLVEVGFISHPQTEGQLKTIDYKSLLADAIALGFYDYLKINEIEQGGSHLK